MRIQQKSIINTFKEKNNYINGKNNNSNPFFDRKVDLITAGCTYVFLTVKQFGI